MTRFYLMQRLNLGKKYFVRSGIRTHAHRSGLRPERSALDHSAILTWQLMLSFQCTSANVFIAFLAKPHVVTEI